MGGRRVRDGFGPLLRLSTIPYRLRSIMFRFLRRSKAQTEEPLSSLSNAIQALSEASAQRGPSAELEERVGLLERTLEARVAEADASFTKADGARMAARNAEERARGMENRARKLSEIVQGDDPSQEEDPFEAAGRRYAERVPESDDAGVEAVPGVLSVMERKREGLASARAAKRGMNGIRG